MKVATASMSHSEPLGPSSIQVDCAWQFAFNLKSGQKGAVGYISDWRGLGGLALDPDIVLWSPTPGSSSPLPRSIQASSAGGTLADQVKCVGVIERLSFGGESTDPIRISAFVSKDNQVKLRYKLVRPLPSTQLKLDYAIIDFDDDSKSWYSALELDSAPSEAQINTGDGALQLSMSFEPTRISESLDINVYRMEFEIVPSANATLLKIATGPQHRYVSEWKTDD
jgi:hypothetical protein